jgi:hypothetical protein
MSMPIETNRIEPSDTWPPKGRRLSRALFLVPLLGLIGLTAIFAPLLDRNPLLALAPCLLMCGAMCAANLCMRPKQEIAASEAATDDGAASTGCCGSTDEHQGRDV